MDKKIIVTIIGLLMLSSVWAQSDMLTFTDYKLARPLINPAGMGHEAGINGMLLYHSRFEKAEYWPSTGAFNINSLIKDKDFGGGLSVLFDKYGPYQKLFAYVSGIYRLKVNEGKFLYFALQAGVNYITNNVDEYIQNDGAEEYISSDSYSQPNFGFGLHFQGKNYAIGIGLPELRYNTLDKDGNKISQMASEMMRIFLYGEYSFKLGKTTSLMPYIVLNYSEYGGMQSDLGAKVRLKEAFEFGLQYRTKEAFAAMVNVKLFDDVWLGYSFAGNTSDVGNKFNSVQEIGLTFHFGKKGKKDAGSEEEKYDEINSIRYF